MYNIGDHASRCLIRVKKEKKKKMKVLFECCIALTQQQHTFWFPFIGNAEEKNPNPNLKHKSRLQQS